ncbi:hypothetical protein KJ885_01250 [Patescibacteria group bacterium]|nr:hypothetical protein [Patescibacteria group bacterium]
MLKQFSKILLVFAVVAVFVFNPLTVKAEEKIPVYYFWGEGCSHCASIKPFLEKLSEKYPEIEIRGLETFRDSTNAMLFLDFQRKYGVPLNERGVPAIFLPGDKFFSGDKPIEDNLENEFKKLVASSLGLAISDNPPEFQPPIPDKQKSTSTNEISAGISFIAITTAALADSVNPCAIAVLIILLSALMMTGERRRAFKGGLAFIASIYICYFLFGIGIIFTIQSAGITGWVYKIVGIIAVLIGLANLKDVFWYGKGFVMEIPRRWRPTLQGILKRITSPIGAFLIGFVVVLFELPCTGGPYFFVLGLLSQNASWTTIIPWLVYYNFIFVLPLIVLAIMIYFGYSTLEKATKWKDKNIRFLHLATGLIMLALGLWVLLQ